MFWGLHSIYIDGDFFKSIFANSACVLKLYIFCHLSTKNMVLKVLDLFSGSKSVYKAVDAKLSRFFEVTSLDVACADINTDILEWDYETEFEPGHFDVIWASPPCTTFSPLRRCNIGRFGITTESIEDDI